MDKILELLLLLRRIQQNMQRGQKILERLAQRKDSQWSPTGCSTITLDELPRPEDFVEFKPNRADPVLEKYQIKGERLRGREICDAHNAKVSSKQETNGSA